MTWAAMISAGVGVWAKKALFSVGIGTITYAGFSQLESLVRSYVDSAWTGLPSTAYNLFALAGFMDAIQIALASLSAAAALISLNRLGILNS